EPAAARASRGHVGDGLGDLARDVGRGGLPLTRGHVAVQSSLVERRRFCAGLGGLCRWWEANRLGLLGEVLQFTLDPLLDAGDCVVVEIELEASGSCSSCRRRRQSFGSWSCLRARRLGGSVVCRKDL